MRVLLDTCALSEMRRPTPHPSVAETIESIPNESLFLSAISIGEITKGASLLPTSKKRNAIENWLLKLERDYASRILPIDAELAHVWGELTAAAQMRGKTIPILDGLIAATALTHGLHLMTRNTKDFEATGVLLLNPWLN